MKQGPKLSPREAWKTVDEQAAKEEWERIEGLGPGAVDDELRAAGISPERAATVGREQIEKAARDAGLVPSKPRPSPRLRRWIAPAGAIAAAAVVALFFVGRQNATDTAAGTSPGPAERGRDEVDHRATPSIATGALALPDAVGAFVAGPLTTEADFVRRTYVRGPAIVTVTLERAPLDPANYERWVKHSQEGYPQAKLDLSAGQGSGYYECTGADSPGCALIVRLRSGVHLEIRAFGAAMRDDLDAIARGLHLETIASRMGSAAQ